MNDWDNCWKRLKGSVVQSDSLVQEVQDRIRFATRYNSEQLDVSRLIQFSDQLDSLHAIRQQKTNYYIRQKYKR